MEFTSHDHSPEIAVASFDNYRTRCPVCGRGGEPPVPLSTAAEQLNIPLWKLRRAAKAKVFPTYYFHDSKALCFLHEIMAAILRSKKEGAE